MPKQYEKRDNAFEEWFEQNFPLPVSIFDAPGTYEAVEDAFRAGWLARKKGEYRLILGNKDA